MIKFLIAVLFLVGPFPGSCILYAYEGGPPDPRAVCQRFDLKTQSEEAVKCYEEVALENPESPQAQYFLGVAYVWAGDEMSTHKQYLLLKKMDYGSAYLLIDVIYHVRPQWIDEYYQEETEELIEIEKQTREKQERAAPAHEDLTNGFEAHVKPRRVSKELEFLQHAQDALSRDDPESAYRLIEDGLVSDYEEVRDEVKHFIRQNPILHMGARSSFGHEALKESIRTYGEGARELEAQRLSIYKTVAPVEEFSEAQHNFENVFGANESGIE